MQYEFKKKNMGFKYTILKKARKVTMLKVAHMYSCHMWDANLSQPSFYKAEMTTLLPVEISPRIMPRHSSSDIQWRVPPIE